MSRDTCEAGSPHHPAALARSNEDYPRRPPPNPPSSNPKNPHFSLKFYKKKLRRTQPFDSPGRSVQPSGRIHQSKAKSQRIAAWELLYRVQHPGRYVSRLQTILHSDIAVKIPRHEDDRRSTKHHCDGSFFRPSSESGSAAVNEDQIHGPCINRLP